MVDRAPESNEFRIEKRRLPVSVRLVDGSTLDGEIFVQAQARYRLGPEQSHDVLNGAEPFFPLALADGETVLLAKAQVGEVTAPNDTEAEYPLDGAPQATVEVTLVDGSTHTGTIYLETPYERPRLLDFLNYFAQRFLTLHAPDGARLVNRLLIARVRQLD